MTASVADGSIPELFTHLLDESSTFYNGVCDIYILGFNVSDDEEINIETIISVSNRSDSRMMFTSTENANKVIMAAEVQATGYE